MRILFMGTPDIAAECLETLLKHKMTVVGAVSQPDKPKGRGHKMAPTDVKIKAMDAGIPVFQPEKIKSGELIEVLEELRPDLIAVVAYGKILPKYVLDYPKYGCINMHASLLPKLRGAAPIQWAVINGDKETGVTTMLMDEGMDTGDILLSEKLKIGEYETSEELFLRIGKIGGELLAETILNIETITPKKQQEEGATYAPMLTKEMGHINWSESTDKISKLICGLNSWPLAYSFYKDDVVKIISAKKGEPSKGENGEILGFFKGKGLKVKTADGSIYIEELQFPGSKKMPVEDYLRGHNIEIGTILK
ncbi:MAG TPA: methionyl-tRNA formyltransferase [Clostridiales bacterium]|nr:methionyl-tRNA formyltransferase [Clostridiales bacterium]